MNDNDSPSALIDRRIAELADWRGALLGRIRTLIHVAEPGIVEEWKWRGVPVWSLDGIVCTGETYQKVVKLTFMRGASIADPRGLFNSSLEGNVRRAVDFAQDAVIDEKAFTELIRDACVFNRKRLSDKKATKG